MKPDLIQRYQQGGDLYDSIADRYGLSVAAQAASAAARGDNAAVNRVLSNTAAGQRTGQTVTDASYDTRGTGAILFDQLTSDPLGAPLDSANRQLNKLTSNTLMAFLRNPTILLVLLTIGAALYVNHFGVPKWARR